MEEKIFTKFRLENLDNFSGCKLTKIPRNMWCTSDQSLHQRLIPYKSIDQDAMLFWRNSVLSHICRNNIDHILPLRDISS